MGNRSSKKISTVKGHRKNLNGSVSDDDFMLDGGNRVRMISQSSYDTSQILLMEKELKRAPQIFFLNNLLMSIMFFENYEVERQRAMKTSLTTMQKELNPTLLRDETIECVIPDVLFENINQNIRFRTLHGPKKHKAEPLIPKRLYVVNDNIEVLQSSNIPQYSAIDKPNYQVRVDETKQNGFVTLRCVEKQVRQIAQNENDRIIFLEPQPGSSQTEEIYDYTTITDVNTPKLLNIINYERRDTLPKSCFTSRKVRKLNYNPDEYESDSSVYQDDDKSIKDEDLFETISYISSKGFMAHFQSAVFPNSLGRALGFDFTSIRLARAIPGRIFCNLVDDEENDIPCETIPSVAIQWPAELTYDFFQREERPKLFDKFGNKYEFPTDDMIKEIRAMSCVLIPRGFTPKKGDNLDRDIQWEVGFPRAERYLDTRMTHAQIRIFLYLLVIFKTYIEPVTKQHGLLIEHIRNFMYWECEANPKDWPEHRLGLKLILVLKNFVKKLSVSHLSDYFIQRKNILENVPNRYLNHAQQVFHQIKESPAIYMLGALRNLVYNNDKFYPIFDYKELLVILTTKQTFQLVNAIPFRPPNLTETKRRRTEKRKLPQGDTRFQKDILSNMMIEKLNREKILQKRQKEKEKEENLKLERRGSVDSIDLEWQCEEEFDTVKSRQIIIFFIRHFIDIAKRSRKIASQKQALLYLKQSFYLAKVLEKLGLESDSREFIKVIIREEEISKKLSVAEPLDMPPSTPKRNSGSVFNWEMTQQVKSNNVNHNNLNTSFHNTTIPPQQFAKAKRHHSNLKNKANISRDEIEDRRKSLETPGRKSVGFAEKIEIR